MDLKKVKFLETGARSYADAEFCVLGDEIGDIKGCSVMDFPQERVLNRSLKTPTGHACRATGARSAWHARWGRPCSVEDGRCVNCAEESPSSPNMTWRRPQSRLDSVAQA